MDYSILVPVYNAEKHLEETILSALAQTGGDSFEIVLVEDGSPDSSGDLCDRFASEYPDKIRVLHRPHQGTVLTRRAAVGAAKGDFIVWLDSDDKLKPECLERISAYRKEYPEADMFIYEMTFYIEANGKTEHRAPLSSSPTQLLKNEKEELYELLVGGNRLDSLCIKAIRRELMQNDPENYALFADNPYGEDVLHCLFPVTYANQIIVVPDELYQYCIHAGSVMHVFDEKRMSDRLNTKKWEFFEPYMKLWGIDDSVHRERLHAAGYKAVLDGVLHFWENGTDKRKLRAFVRSFRKEHPELKALTRSNALSSRQRGLLRMFHENRIGLLETGYRLYRFGRNTIGT